MRTLRRRIESRAATCRVEIGNGVARLHRVDNDTVVDEFERDNARRPRECGVGCLGVAHVIVPVEDDVAGNVVEKLRCTGADRILSLGYCWQRVVLNFDRFSGIARSGQSFGYDQRDWLTDVPHLAERKHGTRRVVPRRAVTIDQWHHAGHSPRPSARTSSPAPTNSTPGMRRAAAASMRLMCACATGERSTKACVIRGRIKSSV